MTTPTLGQKRKISMLKLITLDLDNTLWNVTPTLINAEKILARWINDQLPQAMKFYEKDNLLSLRRQFCLENPEQKKFPTNIRKYVLEKCFLQAGEEDQQAKEYAEKAFSVFIKERNAVTLFPETLSILQHLSNQFPIIALTNGNADLNIIGIDHYFTAHFSAESTGKAKPDTTMFEEALRTVDCSPEETLHIGDHPKEDIEAASAMGLHTIWFNENKKHQSTSCRPTVEIHSLSQLINEVDKIHCPT